VCQLLGFSRIAFEAGDHGQVLAHLRGCVRARDQAAQHKLGLVDAASQDVGHRNVAFDRSVGRRELQGDLVVLACRVVIAVLVECHTIGRVGRPVRTVHLDRAGQEGDGILRAANAD
jgi:hypothetical protein